MFYKYSQGKQTEKHVTRSTDTKDFFFNGTPGWDLLVHMQETSLSARSSFSYPTEMIYEM